MATLLTSTTKPSSTTNSNSTTSSLTFHDIVDTLLLPILLNPTHSSWIKLQQLKQYDQTIHASLLQCSTTTPTSSSSQVLSFFQTILPLLSEPEEPPPSSLNSGLKIWVMEWVYLSLVKLQFSLSLQAQVSCLCVQAITNLLRHPFHEIVKTAIQLIGPMTTVFFAMAIQDTNYIPTWQALLQLRNSLLPLLHQFDLHPSIQFALLKYTQRMIFVLSSSSASTYPPPHPTSKEDSLSKKMNHDEVSLHLVSMDHPHLNREELSKEGAQMLHQFIDGVTSGSGSPARLSLCLQLLLQIARCRSCFAPHIATAYLSWCQLPPHHPFKQDERWFRLLKYGLIHLSKHTVLPSALQTKVSMQCVQWGGSSSSSGYGKSIKSSSSSSTSSSSSSSSSSSTSTSSTATSSTTAPQLASSSLPHSKSGTKPMSSSDLADRQLFAEMLQQLDLHAFPLPWVIEMILQSLQVIEMDELKQAILLAKDVHFTSSTPAVPTSVVPSPPHPLAMETSSFKGLKVSEMYLDNEKMEHQRVGIQHKSNVPFDLAYASRLGPPEGKAGPRYHEEYSWKEEDILVDVETMKRMNIEQRASTDLTLMDHDVHMPYATDLDEEIMEQETELFSRSAPSSIQKEKEDEDEANRLTSLSHDSSSKSEFLKDIHAMDLVSRILLSEPLFSNHLHGHPSSSSMPGTPATLTTSPILDSSRTFWSSMLTRLLGKVYAASPELDDLASLFIDYVCQDFKKRSMYAIQWLYHLPTPTLQHHYFQCILDRVVWSAEPNLSVHHTSLLHFIFNAPSPPLDTVLYQFESQVSKSPTCLMTCIWICKELMMYRPLHRWVAFDVLCRLTRHPFKQVRTPSILTLKQMYPTPKVFTQPIVEFAQSGVLLPDQPVAYELMFALCAKCPDVFTALFTMYQQLHASPIHQKLIRKEMEGLLHVLGFSDALHQAIATFPKGCESIVLKILVGLMEKDPGSTPSSWVDLVYRLYKERGLTGKFLLPIIGKLSQETILSNLPALVKLIDGSEQSKKIWKEVVTRICDGETPLIPPTLFIVTLHQLETQVDLKTLIQALDLSIVELRSLFKHEDLAKSFQQLVENPPTLLMRTMLSALQVHPSLTSFMKTMLIKLTTKHQVWQHKTLWEGFLRVFQKTLPKSVTVIFNLPPLQVHEVLHRVHGAKACVLEFIDSKQLHKQPRVMALATVLGLQEETNGGGGNENGSFTSPSSSSSSSSVSSSTSSLTSSSPSDPTSSSSLNDPRISV